MAHLHSIYDSDKHFMIDTISRTIKNNSTSKTTLIQYDHNSERFTFEMPRYIEGHDMSLCNSIEVHYINIDGSTKEQNSGIYLVEDLQISPDDENIVIFSWLISQNATAYVGALQFLLRFACISEDGVIDYVWNTSIYSGISISKGIYNSNIVAEQYVDTINEWENRLKTVENSIGSGGISPIITVTKIAGGNRLTIVDVNGTKTVNIMDGTNGTNGTNGIDGVNGTNGRDGIDGYNGVDGVSPTIAVSSIINGHRVTITDVNGEHTFDVMDGEDGKSGISAETDPTISEWAKKPNKPTYTANEVGAVTENRVLELITEKLGAIENGTY